MTREDALSGEFREALENVVLPLMSAIHSICWLTWLVAEFPNKVSIDNLNKYDKEAHALLPKVSGYLALVAAYDEQVFIQLKTHVRKLYELDSNVGTFTHKLLSAIDLNDESEIKKNIQRLTQYHDQAVRLEDEIPSSVADLINDAIKRRALIVTSAQTNDLQSPTITQVSGSSDV
jgi:hypothetical protein